MLHSTNVCSMVAVAAPDPDGDVPAATVVTVAVVGSVMTVEELDVAMDSLGYVREKKQLSSTVCTEARCHY